MTVALETLCQLIGADIPHGASGVKINGLAALSDAGPGDLTFISNLIIEFGGAVQFDCVLKSPVAYPVADTSRFRTASDHLILISKHMIPN